MKIKRKVVVGLAVLVSALVIACLFLGAGVAVVLIGVVLAWAGGYLHGRGWLRKSRHPDNVRKGVEHDRAVSQ